MENFEKIMSAVFDTEKYDHEIFPKFELFGFLGIKSEISQFARTKRQFREIFWSKIQIFSIYIFKNSSFSDDHFNDKIMVIC